MNPRMLEESCWGLSRICWWIRGPRGVQRMIRRSDEPATPTRALAGLLRRLHHAAVCILCRALRLVASRQRRVGRLALATGRLPGDGSL